MVINIVVAASENNVIGKDNKLLWHLPNDMAFFKNTTWGMPVIMGRKTFDSLGKPLKGRTNIIITRNPELVTQHPVHFVPPPAGDTHRDSNFSFVHNLAEAITASEATDAKECYVIGGGEIFKQAMPISNRIYMTRVETSIDGDTFFPEIDGSAWYLKSSMPFGADHRHAYPYTFEIWERK
jgi:dihydrofolate reductase